MIRRAKRPGGGYTVIQNATARDNRLTYRARGLLLAMLSHPDDWSFNRDRLAALSPGEGQHAVRDALTELEQFGYLVRTRRSEGGRFYWEHTLYDTPQDVSAGQTIGQQVPNGKTPGQTIGRVPPDDVPPAGRRPSYKDLSPKTVTKEEPPSLASLTPPPGAALPGMPEPGQPKAAAMSPAKRGQLAAFDAFWAIYPRKEGKDTARKAWEKATRRADVDEIMAGVRRFAADPNLPEKVYIPHPGSWLNGGHWGDDPLPPRAPVKVNGRRSADDRVAEGMAIAAELRARRPPQRREISDGRR